VGEPPPGVDDCELTQKGKITSGLISALAVFATPRDKNLTCVLVPILSR
jgi:hypothetical protein